MIKYIFLAAVLALPMSASAYTISFEAELSDASLDDSFITFIDDISGVTSVSGRIVIDESSVRPLPEGDGFEAVEFDGPTIEFDQFDAPVFRMRDPNLILRNGVAGGAAGDFIGTTTAGALVGVTPAELFTAFSIGLFDPTGVALDSTEPPSSLNVDDWGGNASLSLSAALWTGFEFVNNEFLIYEITELKVEREPQVVPLPTGAVLLLTSLTGIGALRRTRSAHRA